MLAQHEGRCLLWGPAAILKGLLEADREVALLVGPRDEAFAPFLQLCQDEAVAALIARHGMRTLAVASARRAMTVALQVARSGRSAVAFVPGDQLDTCLEALAAAGRVTLPAGGAMAVILEDNHSDSRSLCPREAALHAKLPCLESGGVSDVREDVDHVLRLSRSGGSPAAMIVHRSVLRSASTLTAKPNRIAESIEAMIARQRPQGRARGRLAETGGVLRMARRLELNVTRALPNPGERVPVGFITIGPADASLVHLAHELKLTGRLAVLRLGLLYPLDEAVVSRFLSRCEQVVVLEPRPGTMESRFLEVVEHMRRRDERPALLWGRDIPASSGTPQNESPMTTDDVLHPSRLARRIVHLLHLMRPGLHVASKLLPDPSSAAEAAKPRVRGIDVGAAAAIAQLRRMVSDVDQWLRDHTASSVTGEPSEVKRSALAIDGIDPTTPVSGGASPVPGGGVERIVLVELFDARQFAESGVAALRQAARDDRAWIIIVCDVESPADIDVERLVRASIPSERGERVAVQVATFSNRIAMREMMQDASLANGVTVILVRDGKPAQFELAEIERDIAAVDRLGYQPQQQIVWPVEGICAIRPPSSDDEDDEEPSRLLPRAAGDEHSLESSFSIERVRRSGSSSTGGGAKVRFRLQPLYEQIEVIRTRPPGWAWRTRGSASAPKLELPTPRHAKQAQWRFHHAGYRGSLPGAAAGIIESAGRNMGYDVSAVCDPSPVGLGRRAWVQILFTQARTEHDDAPVPLTACAPYGEVDLLLGLDVHETLRAIASLPTTGVSLPMRVAHHERTYAVVNSGTFHDQTPLSTSDQDRHAAMLAAVTRADGRVIEDFAHLCRRWFHADRVADVAMVGVAFQLGLIPVSLEAIELAVRRAEDLGFGRSLEAFEFGRRFVAHPNVFSSRPSEADESIERTARRVVLDVRNTRWGRGGGGAKARSFDHLLRQCLDAMPGLAETSLGREALHDFVIALYRCHEWGGAPYASEYARILIDLYQADRGDRGRMLTRCAVLPLAEVMLIRDPIYIACMAASPEQRRRIRQLLNIKRGRGDQVERRYLTRVELTAVRRRFRADVRTSDWPARIGRSLRWVVPQRWRGTKRERELREYVIAMLERAKQVAETQYDQWADAVSRLHHHAEEDRLRTMVLAELRMLIEPAVRDVSEPTTKATS